MDVEKSEDYLGRCLSNKTNAAHCGLGWKFKSFFSSTLAAVKTIGTGGLEAAVAPNLSKFSHGGGLDLVGFGFIFFGLFFASSRRPPPIGLFNNVPRADSALNSHLMMVSLTGRKIIRILSA